MAQAYVTGPVGLFVGFRNPGSSSIATIEFLGTGETAPDIEENLEHEPVMNDVWGSKLPMDRLHEGSEAVVSVVLTWWRETTVRRVMALPYRNGSVRGVNVVRGAANGYGDVGSAILTEGLAISLWCLFPYSAKTAYQNANNGKMPQGQRFPYSMLVGKPVRKTGTKANKMQLTFQAMRGVVGNNLLLYDEDVSAVENLNWYQS